jgi:preprotein translocase subunit SecE
MAEEEIDIKGEPEADITTEGESSLAESSQPGDEASEAPTNLGATKYVHTAFFVVGILVAFVSGKILAGIWNALAAWPPAVRAVPQLLYYGEDERPSFTMVFGVVIGIITVVQFFRNRALRQWSDDVAGELSKVVWPTRETVTNGTIVVVVASAIATVYVGLLDRLWGFVTTLVYGA